MPGANDLVDMIMGIFAILIVIILIAWIATMKGVSNDFKLMVGGGMVFVLIILAVAGSVGRSGVNHFEHPDEERAYWEERGKMKAREDGW